MSVRAVRRAARETLHVRMAVPAYLIEDPSASPPLIPVEVTVRIHTRFQGIGTESGLITGFADRYEPLPRAVFLASEVTPQRGALLSIGATEAYRIDTTYPSDDQTITAEITRLTSAELLALALPYPDPEPT